jgi:hypothetical protein
MAGCGHRHDHLHRYLPKANEGRSAPSGRAVDEQEDNSELFPGCA